MKHILSKLSKEDIKELSKAIQEQEKKHFGNPLSLRKQEQFMADIFGTKNWSTLLGTSCSNTYKEDAPYQKTIFEVEILSNGYVNDCSLSQLADEIENGDYSGVFRIVSRESLTNEEMSEALEKQGSDPEFILGDDYVLTGNKKTILDYVYQKTLEQYEDTIEYGSYKDIAEKMDDVLNEETQYAIKTYNRSNEDGDISSIEFLLSHNDISLHEILKYITELE